MNRHSGPILSSGFIASSSNSCPANSLRMPSALAAETLSFDDRAVRRSTHHPGGGYPQKHAIDVNDHERVPKVFAELSDEIGGIDRVIVNAGIGKGARLGSGKLWANKATIETNLVAALVQIETALDMFNQRGSGHLVLISSVLGVKGVPGVKAAYAASKAGVRSLGESLRAEYAQRPIRVTVLEPGYIESEMTAKSASTMLMVDNATGVKALVAAIEREPGRAAVPWWPWAPLVRLMWVLPPRLTRRFA